MGQAQDALEARMEEERKSAMEVIAKLLNLKGQTKMKQSYLVVSLFFSPTKFCINYWFKKKTVTKFQLTAEVN